jgi:small-conductance mechanosensitive channel
MLNLTSIINQTLMQQLITFFSITLVSYSLLLLLQKLVISKLKTLAKKTEGTIDDLVAEVASSLNGLFYLSISLLIALQTINLPQKWRQLIERGLGTIFVYFVAQSISIIIGHFFDQFIDKQIEEEGGLDISILQVFKKTTKVLIWAVALIWLLQNLGYDISTIVGGLGIAGVAVAFGIQNILEDIFSYFSIYLDRPFETGDFIIIGEDSGTVEKIGIRSTRLKTLRGEELIVSNKDLTHSRINNFKQMEKRRDEFKLNIDLDTSAGKLEKLPQILEKIIESKDKTEFNQATFKEITDSSYVFRTTYYILSSDFGTFQEIKQQINLEVVKALAKENISLSIPYQIVELKK